MNTVIKLELALSDFYQFDRSPENVDLADSVETLEEYAAAKADLFEKSLQVFMDSAENRKTFGYCGIMACAGAVADDCPEMQAARDFEAKLNEERMRDAI